jgi:hypothetical protein
VSDVHSFREINLTFIINFSDCSTTTSIDVDQLTNLNNTATTKI